MGNSGNSIMPRRWSDCPPSHKSPDIKLIWENLRSGPSETLSDMVETIMIGEKTSRLTVEKNIPRCIRSVGFGWPRFIYSFIHVIIFPWPPAICAVLIFSFPVQFLCITLVVNEELKLWIRCKFREHVGNIFFLSSISNYLTFYAFHTPIPSLKIIRVFYALDK